MKSLYLSERGTGGCHSWVEGTGHPPRVRDPRVNPQETLGKGLSVSMRDRDIGGTLFRTRGGCVTGCGGPGDKGLTVGEEGLGQLSEEGFQEAADDVQVLPALRGTGEAAQRDRGTQTGDTNR